MVINAREHGPGPRVFLASKSPRRRQLLETREIDFTVIETPVDDAGLVPGHVNPTQWVMSLAYLKASSARPASTEDRPCVVVGADTLCVMDGRLIGQPRDVDHARRIITMFEQRSHEVITGVAIVCPRTGRRDMFVDEARVRVGSIGQERIEAYLETGLWRGKAGAYNLSERLEAGWPIEVEGDPATVMGLPVDMLEDRLNAFAQDSRGAA